MDSSNKDGSTFFKAQGRMSHGNPCNSVVQDRAVGLNSIATQANQLFPFNSLKSMHGFSIFHNTLLLTHNSLHAFQTKKDPSNLSSWRCKVPHTGLALEIADWANHAGIIITLIRVQIWTCMRVNKCALQWEMNSEPYQVRDSLSTFSPKVGRTVKLSIPLYWFQGEPNKRGSFLLFSSLGGEGR